MVSKEVTARPIQLSAKGIANIRMPNEDAFVFLVGGTSYSCPLFVAQCLCPRISRVHRNDSTIREFEIPIPDSEVVFDTLLRLGSGDSHIYPASDTVFFFCSAACLKTTKCVL
jgi:hypothetical protein